MSSRKSESTAAPADTPVAFASAATAAPLAPVLAPAPAPSPEPKAHEAAPWPLLCPTPDCNEQLRAHPHPSAPVLFAACGHSHCGLCATTVLSELLPKCTTCGVAVGAGQSSPNIGLGVYSETVLLANAVAAAPPPPPARACLLCAADDIDEPATYACHADACTNKPLCCDHSRFHAKKTGHTPVCTDLAGNTADTTNPASGLCDCTPHSLPISHYCMLHSELLCSSCAVTKHLSCGVAHVKTVQTAVTYFTPDLLSTAATFTASVVDMLHAIPAITTARASMASRLKTSISHFSGSIDAVITALLAHRSRVITAANLKCAEYTKALDNQAEVMAVSVSQLQAAVAMTAGAFSSCNPVRILQAHATVKSMAALVSHYNGPVVMPVVEVLCNSALWLDKLDELSKVVTGRGLKVARVSSLELQPGFQQELHVTLLLGDGNAPSWLKDCDVECAVRGVPVSTSVGVATGIEFPNIARVLSHRVSPEGSVTVAYELMRSSVQAVALQLNICGVKMSPACGWHAHRPRALLSCEAGGAHVRTLPVVAGFSSCCSMAVSSDEKWLVVGLYDACTLSVYSLPAGEHVRAFGGSGDGPLQFKNMSQLCFAPNGHLLVLDGNFRLQEVTLEGVLVRFVGEGVWSAPGGHPWSVAVWNDVIAVGSGGGAGPRVTMLGFDTGAVMTRFGKVGAARGRLSLTCDAVRFIADGSLLVVAEREAKRLSLFSVGAGTFVRCIGGETLSISCNDVCLSARGEYVVTDRSNRRVCVFSADGRELVRAWGSKGTGNAHYFNFEDPGAVCTVGAHLFVLDRSSSRVQLFE